MLLSFQSWFSLCCILDDICVGVMKGVILSVNSACNLVDITRAVAPQDIAAGSLALESSYPYFPAGSIHGAVVNPGVGSGRRALVVEQRLNGRGAHKNSLLD